MMSTYATIRRISGAVFFTILFAGGILITPTAAADGISFQTVRDCDNAAVINCGALSTSAVISAYNSQSYVRNAYGDVGITSTSIKSLNTAAVAGIVNNSGAIYIQNQSNPVATNTFAVSRQNAAGGTSFNIKGTAFSEVAPNQVFSGNAADVFIVMNKSAFAYAIIASNGDPVLAHAGSGTTAQAQATQPAVTPAPKPTPAPSSTKKPTAPAKTTPTTKMTTAKSTPTASKQPAQTPAGTAITEKPTTLTNTGPGTTQAFIALFVAAAVAGSIFSYRRTLRKLS